MLFAVLCVFRKHSTMTRHGKTELLFLVKVRNHFFIFSRWKKVLATSHASWQTRLWVWCVNLHTSWEGSQDYSPQEMVIVQTQDGFPLPLSSEIIAFACAHSDEIRIVWSSFQPAKQPLLFASHAVVKPCTCKQADFIYVRKYAKIHCAFIWIIFLTVLVRIPSSVILLDTSQKWNWHELGTLSEWKTTTIAVCLSCCSKTLYMLSSRFYLPQKICQDTLCFHMNNISHCFGENCKLCLIVEYITKVKWTWGGLITRMKDNRRNTTGTDWQITNSMRSL